MALHWTPLICGSGLPSRLGRHGLWCIKKNLMKDSGDEVYRVSRWGVRAVLLSRNVSTSPPSPSFEVCMRPCCVVLIVYNLGGKPRKAFVNILLGLFGHQSILCNEEGSVSY